MPAIWGDGFDCYAAPADAIAGYWDSGTVGFTLVAGRFSGSQAIQNSANSAWLVKTTTGTTDNNHHIVCAFQQTAAISGTTLGMYFQLSDGATNQVCVVFRSDGAILLTSATPAGTVLDTYTGAVTAANTWYQFEFEIVIHNSAGSWAVRKLGNTSNDRATGGLNTRPGANAQASKLTVGQQATVTSQQMDDLLWRSDTTALSFSGDVRCFTRRPASDAAVQWSPSAATYTLLPYSGATTNVTGAANQTRFTPFNGGGGTVSSVNLTGAAASTMNVKCALFADASGAPGAVLGTATAPIASPGATANVFTFSPPVAVGVAKFWVGICEDAAAGANFFTTATAAPYSSAGWVSSAVNYSVFPQPNPTGLSSNGAINVVPTIGAAGNCSLVAEPQQDAAATYVYSSTVGQSDLYGISSIATTPASIVAVTTRAYLQKSDAGTRLAAVQLKSGSTTVQGTSTALNTTWGWLSRVDTVDPATGLPWTAVGVANAQCGVIVTG